MSLYLVATAVSMALGFSALIALAADRSARERAWRRIADERRRINGSSHS
jgi:hypothetical protein